MPSKTAKKTTSPAPTAKKDDKIDVRSFVYENITPYDGDASFLCKASETTKDLWDECSKLLQKERENNGVLSIDFNTVARIDSHGPGYIDQDGENGKELIVGLQTDFPLKRAIKPFGGVRVVQKACEEKGVELDESVVEIFTKYRKSHNDAVFSVYTDEMRRLRKTGLLTGLPDNYARGRIIGDSRRLALYGADRLIEEKEKEKKAIDGEMTDEQIRLREEIAEQISALEAIKNMAQSYGCDVGRPAENAQEAIQWTYFAYLAAVKEHDGAAMSMGNVADFFDIYIERDIKAGKLDEQGAQDLIDQLVIKLRLVRHLRMSEYEEIFAGDPTWVTLVLGGKWADNGKGKKGKHRVTKTDFRLLQTLYNLGPAPEPNLTVLWSDVLPSGFKDFCAQVSIDTSSIQYENDDLMQKNNAHMGECCDDYGISCCVSYLSQGKQMQYFGARCNLAKTLLLALNEGRDEKLGMKVVDGIGKVKTDKDGNLDYNDLEEKFQKCLAYMASAYVKTMNVIHYMHDKYYYERAQMAFLDADIERVMAFGVAGLSVVADSLSAIKFAKVKPVRNADGLTEEFTVTGSFPCYGNDDDRVDLLAKKVVSDFNAELGKHHIYRNARPTLSILTITSNVMYGKKTGATPDGRNAGEAFAPGANPMHGRDKNGAIASLNSVAKIDYSCARDGVSNTFSIVPKALGTGVEERVDNLVGMLNGYFEQGAHHLNVNVFDRATLVDAMEHPEMYPQLTIRVSGYAVNFIKLSRAHQEEVLARTFHE